MKHCGSYEDATSSLDLFTYVIPAFERTIKASQDQLWKFANSIFQIKFK